MRTLPALLAQLAAGKLRRTVARTGRNGIFLVVAGIFFLTAYAFALFAAALWLAREYDPITAAVVIACATLSLGVIALIIMAIVNAGERRRDRERLIALESVLAVTLALVRAKPLLVTSVLAALMFTSGFLHPKGRKDD